MHKQYISALLFISLSSVHAKGIKLLTESNNDRRTPTPERREREEYFRNRNVDIIRLENIQNTQEQNLRILNFQTTQNNRDLSPSPARRLQFSNRFELWRELAP